MIEKSNLRLMMIAMIMVFILCLSWQNSYLFLKELISAGIILFFVMIHNRIDPKGDKAMWARRNHYATNSSTNVVLEVLRNGDEER